MVRGSYFVLLSLFACFLASAVSVMSGPQPTRGRFADAVVSEPAASILDSPSPGNVAVVGVSQGDSNPAALDQKQETSQLRSVDGTQDDKPADVLTPETPNAGPADVASAEVVQPGAEATELPASNSEESSSDLPESTPVSSQPAPFEAKTADLETVVETQENVSNDEVSDADQPPAGELKTEATPVASPDPAAADSDSSTDPQAATDAPPDADAGAVGKTPLVPGEVVVFTDYHKAMKEATEDRKLLFIYFHDRQPDAAQRAFEKETLGDVTIREQLQRFVFVKLRRDAQITVEGKPVTLLKHPAFAEMLGRQGIAILDLAHPRAEYYGHVVSTFPFTPGKYYRKQALSIILDLPPGTLTQRTMIYAVRIHPEGPASTQGQFHTVLADEAKQHAKYQAAILVQGHHSWDSRFHRINAKLPGGVLAQEVVAESWPNESLVEACIDCVDSWRHSPGHWGAVRSRHPLFGYDIKRGRNGIWYATGIFGRR